MYDIKNPKADHEISKTGKKKIITKVFCVPGKHPITGEPLKVWYAPKRFLPTEGRWLIVNDYVLKRLSVGDFVESSESKYINAEIDKPKADKSEKTKKSEV